MMDKPYFRPLVQLSHLPPNQIEKSVQKFAHEVFNNPQHERTRTYLEGQF